MPELLRAPARVVLMAVGLIALSGAVAGWCYLLRAPTAGWPGPRFADALPLDELPGHDAVPMVVFVGVVAVASLLAGYLARSLGFDGFAIALAVGAGIGGFLYIASAISLFVVRQSSLDAAFDTTRDLPPVYVAAVLFALGVAVIARRPSGEQWLTRLLPAAVGLLGVIEVLSATLPRSSGEEHALGGLLTGSTSPVTRTVEVMIGIVLLLAARGLGRRGRRAFAFAAALIVISLGVGTVVVSYLTADKDTFNVAFFLSGALVLVALVTRRQDFPFAGDPTTRLGGVLRAAGLALAGLSYGVVAVMLNRAAAGLRVHFLPAVHATLYALVLGAPPSSALLPDDFGAWFPWSLRAIVALAVIWGTVTWFAPWHHRPVEGAERREHAHSLVATFGGDTLAPFTLRRDKALYLHPEGPDAAGSASTLIAYRVVRGVALVSGDPIGPPSEAAAAIAAFRAMCAAHGWRFALLGASDRLLDTYRAAGLRPLYHGDEAIVGTAGFSLGGGEMKSVRQAVHRLERKGYRIEILTAGELGEAERGELSALEERWLGGAKRKGFVMELDELFRLDGDDALFVIGRDGAGVLVGFLEIAVCPASSSLSLSSMPRAEEAPNGLNAALIVSAISWAGEHGFEALSLNFSPAARLLDRDARRTGLRRVARRLVLVAKRLLGLQLDNLMMFNRHFGPRWQPRYLVVERLRHLPRVLVSAMAAERYLPFADLLRGRDWRRVEEAESPEPSRR
ncbi:MAG TPA: phosphatidylglycerol lysyltransferase domain-containing protein [Acidimicrobiales bacterium]|nr:phosphatidylglycerol lysyltransferase domain-containing protein [Acidimicrobiales bacterium]